MWREYIEFLCSSVRQSVQSSLNSIPPYVRSFVDLLSSLSLDMSVHSSIRSWWVAGWSPESRFICLDRFIYKNQIMRSNLNEFRPWACIWQSVTPHGLVVTCFFIIFGRGNRFDLRTGPGAGAGPTWWFVLVIRMQIAKLKLNVTARAVKRWNNKQQALGIGFGRVCWTGSYPVVQCGAYWVTSNWINKSS